MFRQAGRGEITAVKRYCEKKPKPKLLKTSISNETLDSATSTLLTKNTSKLAERGGKMADGEKDRTPNIDEKALSTRALGRILDRILDFAEDKITKKLAEHKNQQLHGFTDFIEHQTKQYSYIKNILYFNEPVEIESLYVSLFFSTERYFGAETSDSNQLSDTGVLKKIENGGKIIISATAGAGKSFFLRRALQKHNSENSIPIFFELRNLNGKSKRSIIEAIAEHIRSSIPSLMTGQIAVGLKNGLFSLFLDGFDEIDPELSEHYEREILQLADNAPKSSIILSTRPMDTVLTWTKFSIFYICPLRKNSAIELVRRLQFDEAVKNKFIDAITGDLYDRHKSFFSIPLLVTMMLITFSETGEIEHKITAFYNDAFNALLVRHDAKKEAFRRRLYSELSREAFTKIFASFCIITYLKSQYQFLETEVLDVVGETSRLHETNFDREKVFKDFCITSCMLIREGRNYVFAHRSFQEYFSAVFLSTCPDDIAKQILQRIGERAAYDNVMKMLFELNPQMLEKIWILPRISKINKELKSLGSEDRPLVFAEKVFSVVKNVFHRENDDNGNPVYGVGYNGLRGHELAILGNLYGFQPMDWLDTELLEQLSNKKSRSRRLAFRIIYGTRASPAGRQRAESFFKTLVNIETAIRAEQKKSHLRLEEMVRKSQSRSRESRQIQRKPISKQKIAHSK